MSTPHSPLLSVIDGVDAEAVAAAVQGCAGVSALDSGRFGEVASYLSGRRVPGVVVQDRSVLVGVRSRGPQATRNPLLPSGALSAGPAHQRSGVRP